MGPCDIFDIHELCQVAFPYHPMGLVYLPIYIWLFCKYTSSHGWYGICWFFFSAWKFPPHFFGFFPPGYGCQLVDNDNYRDWKREASSVTLFWSNYSDLTRPHPKWWLSKGNPLISGKSGLVKYYSLTRLLVGKSTS